MSSFEITATQRLLARENSSGLSVLDAGRGNPNWINTQARYAFGRFLEFALKECEQDFCFDNVAGKVRADGIFERFEKEMDPENKTDSFLIKAVDYCVNELKIDKTALLKEFADGIIGDYYPYPSRCLSSTEIIINDYLQDTLYGTSELKDETELFLTEGGSAAICYVIDALCHNRLLKKGDKIAIATPIFSPYLEIPVLNDYDLVSVNLCASEDNNWDLSEEDFKKLSNHSIKAFFIVNPSNPASHAYSDKAVEMIKDAVKNNPDLIVVTDDVYSSFANGFKTIYSVLPYNTILIYSFSKLYGVTGWRLGVIAMNKHNICNDLLTRLNAQDKAFLDKEYSHVTVDVDQMSFIDRITADSRSIGLYHAGGLATPSQIFMDLLALSHLVVKDDDAYISKSKEIVRKRYDAFMTALGLRVDNSDGHTAYYVLVDMNGLCATRYNAEFAKWKRVNISDLDLLNDLATLKGVVLTYGPGFDTPEGYVRVSLANLRIDDYVEIARRTLELIDEYHERYLKEIG